MPEKTVKDNKVYDVKKLIRALELACQNKKVNARLLKSKVKVLVSGALSPAERFLFEYVFSALPNIKYELIKEESLLTEKSVVLMWDDYLNIVNKNFVFNIRDLDNIKIGKTKEFILMGVSASYAENKALIINKFKVRILEYENHETVLFERVK